MSRLAAAALIALAGVSLPMACSSRPTTPEQKTEMASEVSATLDRFKAGDSSLAGELDKAAGYVIFPELGKGGVIVGGSYGNGEVFEKGAKIGYASLSQATIGLQLGAQTFSELIVFKSKESFDNFKEGRFAFAANATAVAAKHGAASSNKYEGGVGVFIIVKGGLMAEAAVGGQKFTFKPL